MKTKITALLLAAALTGQSAFASDKKTSDFEALQKQVVKNLANFDDPDFNVFSNQKWAELKHSHSQDVKVHWPDGHVTIGIEKHIEDLQYLF